MTEADGPTRATGRRVADAMGRVLTFGSRGKQLDGLREGPHPEAPASPIKDNRDQEAFVRHHLGFDADSAAALGGWIEPKHDDATGGKSDYVRFNRFWREWMAEQDRDSLATLTAIGRFSPEQVTAIKAIVRREIESAVKRKIWSRARKIALGAAVAAFAAAHWGAEQLAWIKEKAPLLKELWSWLSGSRT